MHSSNSPPRKIANVHISRCRVFSLTTTAFTSTSHKVCQSYLQTGARTRKATLHAVEEDSVELTAWNAASSIVEKKEVVPVAIDTTTCSTKRSAEGARNAMSLEGNLVAEVRLDVTMLDTAGLKGTIGTDTSRHDVATTGTTATTGGAEVQKGAGVATGTRGEDSAAKIYKVIDVTISASPETLDGSVTLMHSLSILWCASEDGFAVNVGKHRRAQVTVSFVVSAADTSRATAFSVYDHH